MILVQMAQETGGAYDPANTLKRFIIRGPVIREVRERMTSNK